MFRSDRCGNGANHMGDIGRTVVVTNGGGMSALLVEGYQKLNWRFSTAVARQEGEHERVCWADGRVVGKFHGTTIMMSDDRIAVK